MKKKAWIILIIISLSVGCYFAIHCFFNCGNSEAEEEYYVGEPIDSLNGVIVYYNGSVNNSLGRNEIDGYNIGLKYQCVEFVKRYYFEYYNHRMPDTWGHAKDFFNKEIADGGINERRGLYQYTNPSKSKPQVGDLLVWDGTHGHVAIVSNVSCDYIEVIQQNCGAISRRRYLLKYKNAWYIDNTSILGWLLKE